MADLRALLREARAELLNAANGAVLTLSTKPPSLPPADAIDRYRALAARIDAALEEPPAESFEEWHGRECPELNFTKPGMVCTELIVWGPAGMKKKRRFIGRTCREVYESEKVPGASRTPRSSGSDGVGPPSEGDGLPAPTGTTPSPAEELAEAVEPFADYADKCAGESVRLSDERHTFHGRRGVGTLRLSDCVRARAALAKYRAARKP